jgi:hypothetical protein
LYHHQGGAALVKWVYLFWLSTPLSPPALLNCTACTAQHTAFCENTATMVNIGPYMGVAAIAKTIHLRRRHYLRQLSPAPTLAQSTSHAFENTILA